MTVCIAAICRWKNDDGSDAGAVITASDRMMTRRGESEYEPPKRKLGNLRKSCMVMIAGDVTVHSEAIQKIQRRMEEKPTDNVLELAELYGSFIREFRLREATQTYLSPLGMGIDALKEAQEGDLLSRLADQMQGHSIEAEAIVAGTDSHGIGVHIYHVDARGFVTCHDDVGFLAIGLGASHAESQMMAFKYANTWGYAPTALTLYSAKKRAEVAPGVGSETDMYFIGTGNAEPILDTVTLEIETIYKSWVEQEYKQMVDRVQAFATFLTGIAPGTAKVADHTPKP